MYALHNMGENKKNLKKIENNLKPVRRASIFRDVVRW